MTFTDRAFHVIPDINIPAYFSDQITDPDQVFPGYIIKCQSYQPADHYLILNRESMKKRLIAVLIIEYADDLMR